MSTFDDTIETANHLIQTCKDGEEGFKHAASGVKDEELKNLFLELALQRNRFAGELQDEVIKMGREPKGAGSMLGALQRGWINIKAAVSSEDEKVIISEVETGEDAALESYQEALNRDISGDLRTIIQRQYSAIRAAHDRVSEMKNIVEAKHSY